MGYHQYGLLGCIALCCSQHCSGLRGPSHSDSSAGRSSALCASVLSSALPCVCACVLASSPCVRNIGRGIHLLAICCTHTMQHLSNVFRRCFHLSDLWSRVLSPCTLYVACGVWIQDTFSCCLVHLFGPPGSGRSFLMIALGCGCAAAVIGAERCWLIVVPVSVGAWLVLSAAIHRNYSAAIHIHTCSVNVNVQVRYMPCSTIAT